MDDEKNMIAHNAISDEFILIAVNGNEGKL
jgi:hypothetical protein